MSDLSSGSCGCNDTCGCIGTKNTGSGCNSFIWIILLLFLCNGNSGIQKGCGCDTGCGSSILGFTGGNNCCEWIIWLLLLSCICGGNNGFNLCC